MRAADDDLSPGKKKEKQIEFTPDITGNWSSLNCVG